MAEQKKLTTSERLSLVLKTQEQRAAAYTKWEMTFRQLLNDGVNDEQYLMVVQDLMQKLQSVSNVMRETATIFEDRNLKKISKFIRNLQELEKEKMNLTMEIQQKILKARPVHNCTNEQKNEHSHSHRAHACNHESQEEIIWRPRLHAEKQRMADVIEQINDLLAEIKELKNTLKGKQQIIINGSTIMIQTNDDCKVTEITGKHKK